MSIKTCKFCDRKYAVTNSHAKRSWEDMPICRECKYITDIFSFNGNRLKAYSTSTKRCLVCKTEIDPHNNQKTLCDDPYCKKTRHNQIVKEGRKEKRKIKEFENAKRLLNENGFLIIEKPANTRIIIEPITTHTNLEQRIEVLAR